MPNLGWAPGDAIGPFPFGWFEHSETSCIIPITSASVKYNVRENRRPIASLRARARTIRGDEPALRHRLGDFSGLTNQRSPLIVAYSAIFVTTG
jgi:hypothetical protein